jgi:hypothetical protein
MNMQKEMTKARTSFHSGSTVFVLTFVLYSTPEPMSLQYKLVVARIKDREAPWQRPTVTCNVFGLLVASSIDSSSSS